MADEKPDPTKIQFLQDAVDIYDGYKISKDGESRKEDVDVMKGVSEEEQGRNVGWRIMKKVYGGKDEGNGSDKSE